MFLKRVLSYCYTCLFWALNGVRFFFTTNIKNEIHGSYEFRGCNRNEIKQADEIYNEANGFYFEKARKFFLYFFSRKTVVVCMDIETQKVIGINLFYINRRDLKDQTVHEGLVCVLSDCRGKGIAKEMRKHAIAHFSRQGFRGISSRISCDNTASLRSAEHVGFKVIEKYYDEHMKAQRYYLIRFF